MNSNHPSNQLAPDECRKAFENAAMELGFYVQTSLGTKIFDAKAELLWQASRADLLGAIEGELQVLGKQLSFCQGVCEINCGTANEAIDIIRKHRGN